MKPRMAQLKNFKRFAVRLDAVTYVDAVIILV